MTGHKHKKAEDNVQKEEHDISFSNKANDLANEVKNDKEIISDSKDQEVDVAQPKEETVDDLKKQIVLLEAKLVESNDKLLRAYADFENYRKRSMREKSDIRITVQFDVISSLLPVMDHFERALISAEKTNSVDAILEGMKLIKNEFDKALNTLGIEIIETIGKPFDPNFHEAIAKEFSDEYPKDIVIKQWRTGYKLGDKLLRPASVIVSSGTEIDSNEE